MKSILFVFVLLTILPGCSAFRTLTDEEANSAGAAPIFPPVTEFEQVNIFTLLDPATPTDAHGCRLKDADGHLITTGDCLGTSVETALASLHKNLAEANANDEAMRLTRARIQARIVGASNQRCENFKKKMHKFHGDANYLLGSAATLFGGAGPLFAHEGITKTLSALSGITSGVRAEFNADYFRSMTIEVIAKGIDARRQRIHKAMKKRAEKPLTEYTIEDAIGDAILYHGSCTVIAGLQEAGDSITVAADPGLARLSEIIGETDLDVDLTLKSRPETPTSEGEPPEPPAAEPIVASPSDGGT